MARSCASAGTARPAQGHPAAAAEGPSSQAASSGRNSQCWAERLCSGPTGTEETEAFPRTFFPGFSYRLHRPPAAGDPRHVMESCELTGAQKGNMGKETAGGALRRTCLQLERQTAHARQCFLSCLP